MTEVQPALRRVGGIQLAEVLVELKQDPRAVDPYQLAGDLDAEQ